MGIHRLRAVCWIFVISLGIRIGVVYTIPEIRVSSDSEEYLALTETWLDTGSFTYQDRYASFRTPGYPLFLAGLRAFGIQSPRAIAVSQTFLSSVTVCLIFIICLTWFTPYAAWAAAVLMCFYPGDLISVASILTEPLFVLVVVGLVYLQRSSQTQPSRHSFWIGCLLGFSALVRPITGWLWLPLSLFYYFKGRVSKQGGWTALCCFVIGVALTQGSWMARNWLHSGSFYLSEISAASLYVYWSQGVVAATSGMNELDLYDSAWQEWHMAEQNMTPPEMNAHFTQKSMAILSSHPVSLISVMGQGMVRQVIDSSWMKLIRIYVPEYNVNVPSLARDLLYPESLYRWSISLCLVCARLIELLLVSAVYIGGCHTFVSSFRVDYRYKDQRVNIWIIGFIIAYLFLLSSAPSANERFRQQYFALLVILAAPSFEGWANRLSRKWRALAHSWI